MKIILMIAGLTFGTCTFGQNKITGRWKPLLVTIDKVVTADIKADTVYFSDSLNVILKNDKDPEASKKELTLFANMMGYKMQGTEQEFAAPGIYTEINKLNNTSKKGTYTFDEKSNLLITTLGGVVAKYTVSFKNTHLVLQGELGSGTPKKMTFIIEYEKI